MFSLTSFNIPDTKGLDPSAELSRRAAASAMIGGAAAIALLASVHTVANAAENSSRTAREHHASAIVMGRDPSGRSYDTCIRSLDKSLSEWIRRGWRRGLMRANEAHVPRRGSQPGTPASRSAW